MSAVTYGELRGADLHGRAGMRPSDRAIAYAVLLSLVLHGALLFSFSMRPSGRRAATPGPIVAHLVALPAPAVPAPSPPPAPPAEPQRAQPKPTPPQPRLKPPPKPASRAEAVTPAPKPAPPAPAAPAASPAPSEPAQASVAPQAAPAAPLARTEPQPSVSSGAEADALHAYRSELIQVAKKYKRYPRVAMDNNWEGRAVVRMVVGANGLISSIVVTTSAGHEVLDKQAQEMVRRAKTLVPIPAYLRGKDFSIEVPVIYHLKGEDAG